ncbi:MAG TPA: bifunctional phosphoribosylaminoimidazolecarboxamide formyltransferase/IMP cyclohydrolase [Trebonia sp.]|nr:bifunctional phosphoribosylaminoimidazolecarboxamide formyltransferase/IMP cyclohydrolase [Trebonia sp.]
MTRIPIKRALVSVYDKDRLPDLARALHAAEVEIVSTGSTASAIEKAGIPVTRVESVTSFPECLDGRVKTLHPKIHAGLLADTSNDDHVTQLDVLAIEPFQLLVSNLYPFEQTVAKGATHAEAIEQIDIGGPAMVRAASKNHGSVAVVTSPAQYDDVSQALADGGFTLAERKRLAAAAFAHTAAYDAAVASWFASAYAPDAAAEESGWPAFVGAAWSRADVLRYGENPHQKAALYVAPAGSPDSGSGIATAELLHGKAMSYNNYVDADAARRAAYDFDLPCVAIIKHSNPCGIAIGTDIADAHAKAHATDPVSAFGGVIAANATVTAAMAQQVADVFTEVVIAPDFEPEALEILSQAKNVRLLRCRAMPGGDARSGSVEYRPISGGMLSQTADLIKEAGDDPANWELKAGEAADAVTLADLTFAWRACRSVKSNAILLASGGAAVGIGMGQVNRVDSSRLAVARAGNRAAGSVAASDAYFPFADAFEILAEAGVRAVAEPGGSIRDNLTIEAAKAAGITLYFTGVRHFYH